MLFLITTKDIIRIHKPTILGLLETRVSGEKADTVCRKLGFDYWVRVEALGFSGGIWVLWKECMKVDILKTHPQFIHMQIDTEGGRDWLFSMVYGSPNVSLRKFLLMDRNRQAVDLRAP